MTNKNRNTAGGIYVFGVERIGQWALKKPIITTSIFFLLAILSSISIVQNIKFDGSIVRILANDSAPYHQFLKLESEFRPFSYDEVALVRSPNLLTATGFEKLRDLHLDLQLVDEVSLVISIFSLVEKGQGADDWRPVLSGEFENDDLLRRRITALLKDQPTARSLLAPKHGMALLLLMHRLPESGNAQGFSHTALQEIEEVFELYAADSISAQLVGKPTIEKRLVNALIWDQIILSASAIIVCSIVALIFFESISAAIVCMLPILFALIFYLGFISAIGASIDLLTTVIPAVIIVLAFADALHLFFHWRRFCDQGREPVEALDMAIATIGPACALAAATTAVAFLALSAGSNDALNAMALSGIAGVLIVFLTVVCTVPVAAYWSVKFGASYKSVDKTALHWASGIGQRMLDRPRRTIVAATIAAAALLTVTHYAIKTQYQLLDYTPRGSPVRTASAQIDQYFGGAGQIFAVMTRERADEQITVAERKKLLQIEAILREAFDHANIISLASAASEAEDEISSINLAAIPKSAEPFLTRFVSKNKTHFLITIFISYNTKAEKVRSLINDAIQKLNSAFPQIKVEFTGGPAFRATAVPKLIFDLRHGLILSVLVSTIVIGLAIRSWQLGLACLLPNILPILGAQLVIWLLRGGIDITTAIALTIGFGLAIDDSVHLLNHYVIEKERVRSRKSAMQRALRACSPALVLTTIVLGVGMAVGFFSAFPTVGMFSLIVISILIFALLADILVLPSVAVRLDRFERKIIRYTSRSR